MFIAKPFTEFAYFQRQSIAVIRLASPDITLGLQGLQQPAYGGAVQPALLSQLRGAGPAIEAVQAIDQCQTPHQTAHGFVFGLAHG
ncbi:hypothetical protein PS723_00293 [Pseudomonas fluorescens]|uniref:Uncharacterized protein n=1 Tax=Pseudomonas fluorescens TaxID=294 RepID=A0A5E6ZWR4_PSEFL|nr:hypothetical protein PS723_00293 [Pseudomonas fluorescens]